VLVKLKEETAMMMETAGMLCTTSEQAVEGVVLAVAEEVSHILDNPVRVLRAAGGAQGTRHREREEILSRRMTLGRLQSPLAIRKLRITSRRMGTGMALEVLAVEAAGNEQTMWQNWAMLMQPDSPATVC
jgi:hypothetical protein